MSVRVAIVTSGRFHVLDLARELAALGNEVRFYSYVPRRRAQQFGLPAACHRALLPAVFPFLVLAQRGPRRWRSRGDRLLRSAIDRVAARRLEPCDVVIGMSGLMDASARKARRKFGAQVFLERGSRHILSQQEILEKIPGASGPAIEAEDVRRELDGYAKADVIVVPSYHAERSFLERGTRAEQLFRNPYGVDLTMFPPTLKPANATPTVVMAGTWSLRKGCDLLWQACQAAGSWRLLHVGPLGDAPVPVSPLFEHRAPVPQWQLPKVLAGADVFALASREEGLSLVQAQALACGLPLVCTDRTGGEDLREMLADPSWVTVVPHDNASALQDGIAQALAASRRQAGKRDVLGAARQKLAWAAYGQRYHARVLTAVASTAAARS